MGSSNKTWGIVIICVILITGVAAGVIGYKFWLKKGTEPLAPQMPKKILVPVKPQPVIDYNQLEKDQNLKELMQQRKAKYGLEKGIDMITKSDESVRIGESTVPMQEILDEIRLKVGDIIEKDLKSGTAGSNEKSKEFGIYVVQPGDNIWNIHFKFLKDYFDHKGVALSTLADEPDQGGRSSGVGKILKFSENTVQIYNIKERKLDIDLNLIVPLSKVVVYNMEQIFALLDLIDYQKVHRIQFDGETIWIPAE
ncbi:MAG: hypothetical protein ABIK98_10975 [Pseudomonadota bacterium]